MILFSAVDEVVTRFPQYIAELRSFLSGHGLPVASPEAVNALAQHIEAGGEFRDDLLSMLAAICAGEPEVSYLELLGMLLVAAAGPEEASRLEGTPGVEEGARRVFNFVLDARRAVPQDDGAGDLEPPIDLPSFEPDTPEATPEATVTRPAAPLIAAVPPAASSTKAESPRSALARALALSAEEEEFSPSVPPPAVKPAPAPLPAPQASVPFLAAEPAPAASQHWVRSGVIGVCGLVLGVLIGALLERKPLPQPAAPANSAVVAGENAAAHGAAVRERAVAATRAAVAKGRETAEPADDADPRARALSSGKAPDSEGAVAFTTPAGALKAEPARRNAGAVSPAVTRAGTAPGPVREINLLAPAAPNRSPSAPNLRPHTARVLTGSSGIMAANLLSAPAPAYPAEASAAQVQGEVVIEAVVGKDGDVIDTRIVSGPPMLRDAALSAVQRWRYRPYEVDGSPAEIATTARIEFRLE